MGNTSKILEDYKKQLEEDRKKENSNFDINGISDDLPEGFNIDPVNMEDVMEEVRNINDSPYDMENIYKKFHDEYVKISEKELTTVLDEDIKVGIKHAYCPKCGRELVSKAPTVFNPFTFEKISKHECECGFKCNLEYAYPRIVYVNSNGEEIKAFNE